MSENIFVIVEQRGGNIQKISLELLGKAKSLADDLGQQVVAVLLGQEVRQNGPLLFAYGADRVIVVEDSMLEPYSTEPYTKGITAVIEKEKPEIVLFGATAIGRDLAPRVAGRIHTGLTADCTGLSIDPESRLLHMTRPAFGGNIMATIVCKNYRPQMATVRAGVMKMREADTMQTGEISEFKVEFTAKDKNVEILEIAQDEKKPVDITAAKILVAGGRGVGGANGFEPLRMLASELGGEIASSRVGVDSGWIEKERQVGQTGKTVRPLLYIACGISGAIQHLAGMEDAEFILAINKDVNAPMMDAADLAIVGDLHVIVPKLIEAIRTFKLEKR